jgi:hypothetical protein
MSNYTFFLLVLCLTNCVSYEKSKRYILPYNYSGTVIIFYNQPTTKSNFNSEQLTFHIPIDGVLQTDCKLDWGLKEFPTFYDGLLTDDRVLKVVLDIEKCKPSKRYATLVSNGKAYEDIKQEQDKNEQKFVYYSVFFVGTKEEIIKHSENFAKIGIHNYIKKYNIVINEIE